MTSIYEGKLDKFFSHIWSTIGIMGTELCVVAKEVFSPDSRLRRGSASSPHWVTFIAAEDTKHLYHLYEEDVLAFGLYQEWGNKWNGR